MPLLPSGKTLYITNSAILGPNTDFFTCPEGHFWYTEPDLAIHKPPFEPGMNVISNFVHAPVPNDREEVKKYIHILIGLEGDHHYWRGDLLSGFPVPGELDDADLAAWNEWLHSRPIQEFLDESIEKCRVQALSNRNNRGMVTVKSKPRKDTFVKKMIRFNLIKKRVSELEGAADAARADGDENTALAIYTELEELLDETVELRRQHADISVGSFVEGYLNRVLHRWATAESCFRERLRSKPFDVAAWLELTWCLAEQRDFAEAETAARRVVKLDPENASAHGNLASVLIQLGRKSEARGALDKALELEPDNPKNQYTDKNFEDHFSQEPVASEVN